MADKYIDKVKKDGQEYDIHDNRVDDLSSGTKLYKHSISALLYDDTNTFNVNISFLVLSTSQEKFSEISSQPIFFGQSFCKSDSNPAFIYKVVADSISFQEENKLSAYLLETIEITTYQTFTYSKGAKTLKILADEVTEL